MTVMLATFMEVLDTSIANVALPHIAGSLSASVDESTWVLTSYLIANAIILPLSGWLSELFGRKRFYMTCVVIFTGSSLLCGMAPSLQLLVFFRILQGLGGGGLQPSAQAILADTFTVRQRGMAFSIYGMAVVFAPAIGPTLGGWITDSYSWRWLFYINIPVGILSLMLVSRLIHNPPAMAGKPLTRANFLSMDWMGMSLLALGLGALEFVLDKGQEDDWFGSGRIRFLAVVAVFCLIAVIVRELVIKNPVVNLRLYRERNFCARKRTYFLPRICAGRQYGSAAAVSADADGLLRDARRDGSLPGRGSADICHAHGRISSRTDRRTAHDHLRVHRARRLAVDDLTTATADRLRHLHAHPNDGFGGVGGAVYSDQHDLFFAGSARQK